MQENSLDSRLSLVLRLMKVLLPFGLSGHAARFCMAERHHTSCYTVTEFIVWLAQLGSTAECAQSSVPQPLDLARLRPARPEAIAHCLFVSREKKVEASDPQHHRKG
jgi:hypothetical protein